MAVEQPRKRRRRPTFSESDILIMLEEVRKRITLIMTKHQGAKTGITNDKKAEAWEQVRDAVNLTARVPRSVEELRRKFKDMRTQLKAKIAKTARECPNMEVIGEGLPIDSKFSKVELVLLKLQSSVPYPELPSHESEGLILPVGDLLASMSGVEEHLPSVNGAVGSPTPSTSAAMEDPSDNVIVVVGEEKLSIPIIPYSTQGKGSTSTRVTQSQSPIPPETPPVASSQATPLTPVLQPASCPPSRPTTSTPGQRGEHRQAPSLLSTQQEIRDLLHELVKEERSSVVVQRDTTAALREAVGVVREGVEAVKQLAKSQQNLAPAVQELARSQKDIASAVLAISQVMSGSCGT